MKYLCLIITFFVIQFSFSQEPTVAVESTDAEVEKYDLSMVEVKPEFPGGANEFYKYVGRNFRTPDVVGFKGGKLVVTFVIEKDGSITDVKSVRDLGFGTADEAKRVLQNSPKWTPGVSNGKTVRVMYTLPITLASN